MLREDLAWNLYVELRKELLATQQLRARAIEFKITLVTTSLGLMLAYVKPLDPYLLLLPAFAAAFFDLLIISYSFAVKRKGAYIRTCLEPLLREYASWPDHIPLWEEYMRTPSQRQLLSFLANVGLTVLAGAPGVFLLTFRAFTPVSLATTTVFALLLVCVVIAHARLGYFILLRYPSWRRSVPFH